jgi:hypothetical protein
MGIAATGFCYLGGILQLFHRQDQQVFHRQNQQILQLPTAETVNHVFQIAPNLLRQQQPDCIGSIRLLQHYQQFRRIQTLTASHATSITDGFAAISVYGTRDFGD